MKKNIAIAIDGPAGTGKSTVASMISKDLNITYLDTGAMYRTFALYANRKNVNTGDWFNLRNILVDFDMEVKYINNEQRVIMFGEDVTGLIRTNQISKGASEVSAVPEVRIKLVELQREIACKTSVIMDGRDIGAYVLPNADVKVFLAAAPEVRARRRYLELLEKGDYSLTEAQIKEEIIQRDKNDSEREFSPLRQAEDAILVDTSDMTIEEVVERIKGLINSLEVEG